VTVIPVIDIRNGVAVRAIKGDRANYLPLATPLCVGSDPIAVAQGLIALHPFQTLYLADLDAIEGRPANTAITSQLAADHPGLTLWVDRGTRAPLDVAALLTEPQICAVIGSETGITSPELRELTAQFGPRIILSLDFRKSGFVGDPAVLADQASWPRDIIVMTLTRVGANKGPDLAQAALIKHRHKQGRIFVAGGIRHAGDLRASAHMGAAGALVSSALHAQTITAKDLG
jgi:HisA/HisF family protein